MEKENVFCGGEEKTEKEKKKNIWRTRNFFEGGKQNGEGKGGKYSEEKNIWSLEEKKAKKEKEENIWRKIWEPWRPKNGERRKGKYLEKNIWSVEEKMSREGKGRKYGEGKLMLTPTTKTNNRKTGKI